jgi:dolichyl-phosphate beta-glucosyltransferase
MTALALSVVLPVFNEALVLEQTFATLIPYLEGIEGSFEVICVDDGSTDDSLAILRRFSEKDPRIRVDGLPRNRGKGAAVREGMLMAEGERVLFMDVDLSTPLEEIRRFLGALDSDYEVVIGNRRAPGSQITRHQPWIRETLGKGFTILTRLLLAPGVHDFTCGFKGFRRDAAREIFRRSTLDGWAFDAELVVIAQELGCKLAQVPVSWAHEEGTKVRLLHAVLGSLHELLLIRWKCFRGAYR